VERLERHHSVVIHMAIGDKFGEHNQKFVLFSNSREFTMKILRNTW
jgi:hypothetical protein